MQDTPAQTKSSKYMKYGHEAKWGALISAAQGRWGASSLPLYSRTSNLDLPKGTMKLSPFGILSARREVPVSSCAVTEGVRLEGTLRGSLIRTTAQARLQRHIRLLWVSTQ